MVFWLCDSFRQNTKTVPHHIFCSIFNPSTYVTNWKKQFSHKVSVIQNFNLACTHAEETHTLLRHAPPRVSAQFRAVGQLVVITGCQLALSAAMAASNGTDWPWASHVGPQTCSQTEPGGTGGTDWGKALEANGSWGQTLSTRLYVLPIGDDASMLHWIFLLALSLCTSHFWRCELATSWRHQRGCIPVCMVEHTPGRGCVGWR